MKNAPVFGFSGFQTLHIRKHIAGPCITCFWFTPACRELALPPVLSTDPATNAVRLSIGDLIVHVGEGSTTLVEFAISAEIDLKMTNENGALKLVTDAASIRGKVIELSKEVTLNVNDQTVEAIAELAIREISDQSEGLLDALPIPTFGAIMLGQPQVRAADGYLMIDADITAP
jgi:hypothetical protein